MVFLSIEGVRLVAEGLRRRHPRGGLRAAQGPDGQLREGRRPIFVCSPCFKKRGLDETQADPRRHDRRRRQARRVPRRRRPLRQLLTRRRWTADRSRTPAAGRVVRRRRPRLRHGLLLLIRRHIDPLRAGAAPGDPLAPRPPSTRTCPRGAGMTGNELVSCDEAGRQRELPRRQGRRSRPRAGDGAHAAARPRMPAAVARAPAVAALPSLPAGPRRRRDPAAVGDGHRQLAAAALDVARRSTTTSTAGSPRRSSRPPPTTRSGSRSRRSSAPASTCVTDGEQRRDSYASFVGGAPRQLPARSR